jgi:hypothetical protein
MANRYDEREREELPDSARFVRWVGPAFALFTLVLIPWIAYLAGSLPERQVSHHYDLAWVGYDIMEAVALGATAFFAFRRSRYLALAAAAAATLLVVDAWFDVVTSPRHEMAQAIVLAVVIELPLASVCAWLSYHTEHLEARQLDLLLAHRWRRRAAPRR